MIKNSLRIFRSDLRKIFTNSSALIIVIALSLLPSLYAWFNIKACWDPYSEKATGQIKVAVINKDNGTILNNEEINLGDKVIEELKDNKTLGWCFMNEEESNRALENGNIYASITIDSNFSEDIISFTTSDIEKGEIIYSVNEKINAIAPKITSKGATAVQEKVSAAVVETVSKVVLETAKEAGYIIKEDVIPKLSEVENILTDIEGKFDTINSTVDEADTTVERIIELIKSVQNDMPIIKSTIASTEDLTESIEKFIDTSKQGLNRIAPAVKEDITIVNKVSRDISGYCDEIIKAINGGSEDLPLRIASLKEKVSSMKTTLDSVIGLLEKLNDMSINKQLQNILTELYRLKAGIDGLDSVIASLEEGINNGSIDVSSVEKIKDLNDNVSVTTESILNNYDTEIVGKINEICDEAFVVSEDVLKTLDLAKTKLPEVDDLLNSVLNVLGKSDEGLTYLKANLPSAEEKISTLKDKISEAQNNNEVKELIDLLLNDVEKRSEFLASPVEIIENDLFKMGNYGTAMTPFYSVLCLWVGGTLLASMLRADAYGAYKANESYFGKLMLFVSIGIAQAVIAALGDLFLLNIYRTNGMGFFIGLVFIGIVFITIIYSLVSVFGNIGKVIAIILLVLQVAGSGGTFPIQLIPRFFQIINPYLPFTYAISLERETIGGIVKEVMYIDVLVLSVFLVLSIILSLLLKRPFNKFIRKFTEKFEESGLGE